jgi:hypothetical protein
MSSSSSSTPYHATADAPAAPAGGTAALGAAASSDSNSNDSEGGDNKPEITPDELSRRMFFGGMLGLPWLWIAHTLYWYGKQREDRRRSDDDDDGRNGGRQEQDDSSSSPEILLAQKMWVQRCRNSAIVVTASWVAWVLIVQVLLTDHFPDSWFVAQDSTGEATGW